jgi:hypothetical protein
MIALFCQLALAQGQPEEEVSPYEVTVVGEVAIRDARAQVIHAAEAVGWDAHDRGTVVVLRPPASWLGGGMLTNDGEVIFGRPVLALAGVEAQQTWDPDQENPNLATATGLTTGTGPDEAGPYPPTAGARFWLLPTRGRLEAAHRPLLAAVADELARYDAVIRASRKAAAPPAPPPPPPPR